MPERPVLTFDLFSALVDSRSGGSGALASLADRRGWPVSGTELYDRWDARFKAAQRDCRQWVPFAELARAALAAAYAELGLEQDADPDADADELLGSVGEWPLWPDVTEGLAALRGSYRLGLLSNVDDDVFARTAVAPLVDDDLVLTSQRLQAYKPDPRIYLRAQQRVPGMVHVATSARDVRGATEAGIPFVRLRRPGHTLGHEVPPPRHEAGDMTELAEVLRSLHHPRTTTQE